MKNSRTHDKKKIQAALIIAAFAVIMLFTACKQFLDDPEEFLSYWASEAFVKDHNISSTHRPDKTGVQCVGSSDHAVITLTAHNPKSFSLVMPTSSAPAGIVEFKELSAQPTAGTDYELIQTGSGSLLLTYKKAFLEKYEQGSGGLNPTITLKATDGRVFQKTYTFGIKSNSPPPKPNEIVIAKTTETTPHYVLCLKFKPNEMTKTVTIGSGPQVPVHKDIRSITIKDNTYTLLYKDDNSNFQEPAETTQIGSFITSGSVVPLTASSPSVPAGAWVLYFKTEVPVESNHGKTLYAITLRDAEGVVSDSITAGLTKKFQVEFDVNGGDPTSKPANQYIPNDGTVTRPTNPTRTGYDFGGWYTDNTSYSTQWDFDNNTVTQDITLYAKWTAGSAAYTVEHYQEELDGSYPTTPTNTDNETGTTGANAAYTPKTETDYPGFEYDSTRTKINGVVQTNGTINAAGDTVVQLYYKRKTYNVNFSVNGSNGSITATNVIGGSVTGSPVAVKHGGSVTFTASPNTGYEVDSWSSNVTPQSPNTTATLTVTAPVTVTVSFRQKTYTVTYSVVGSVGGRIQAGLDTPTTSSSVSVAHNGSVTFTAYPDTGWEVDSWSNNVTNISTDKKTATLSGVTAATAVTVTFKKTYTVTFKVDGGHGSLKGAYNGSEETAAGGGEESFTVLDGRSVTFTAQPDRGYEVDSWTGVTATPPNNTTATLTVTADTTVTVKFKPGTIELKGGRYAWSRLMAEASGADGAGTIIIDGEIKAGNILGDFGEITVGRNLTIKGKNASAVLDANRKSPIFRVSGGAGNGKTLILEDITLKNGFLPSGAHNDGGGVLVKNYNTLIMKNAHIIDCEVGSNGGGVCSYGRFKMQGSSTITGCKTTGGQGGGVYGSVEMQDGALVTYAPDKNDVFLNYVHKITVTGTLGHRPAARITLNSTGYNEGRVVVEGASAEEANFTVPPKNGSESWRCEKVGSQLKLTKN